MCLAVHATDVRIAVHPSQVETLQEELPQSAAGVAATEAH